MSEENMGSLIPLAGAILGSSGLTGIVSHYMTIRLERKNRDKELISLQTQLQSNLTKDILEVSEERTKRVIDRMDKQLEMALNNYIEASKKLEEQSNEINRKEKIINDLLVRVERLEACRKVNKECPFNIIEGSENGGEHGLVEAARKKAIENRRKTSRSSGSSATST